MAISEEGSFHLEMQALPVHLKDEVPVICLLAVQLAPHFRTFVAFSLAFLDQLPTEHRQNQTGIISTGQHQAIEQLFNCIDLTHSQTGTGPFNSRLEGSNADFLAFDVYFILITEFNRQDAGHYLSQ